jgi:PIN domain nuclease of toxin-antitoxin system
MLATAFITSANMVEVMTKVERLSGQGLQCAEDLIEAGLTVVPVGWREVQFVPQLRQQERGLPSRAGLSLGDVTCISYAIAQEMEIWTADRSWAEFDLPVPVSLIR